MEPIWLLCGIIAVTILLFVIFAPTTPPPTIYRVSKSKADKAVAGAGDVCGDLEGKEGQRCIDREMLKSFYPPPLREDTPVDYPKQSIGACPYSRPMSKPLPLTDIPMCLMEAF